MTAGPFSRDDLLVGGLALLLIIVLLFFPWFSISASFGTITVSGTLTATQDPDGWTALIGMLAALLVIVDLSIERFSPSTSLPNIGGSRSQTRFVLAAVAVGFVALKFLLHIHFSYFGFGFYAAVVVSAGLIYAALQARKTSATL